MSHPVSNQQAIAIRPHAPSDWFAIWHILAPVFRAGETYAIPVDISEADARRIWLDTPLQTFVAQDEAGQILGTYYLKPNQAGNGSHVCNCGYVVSDRARNRGIASCLCAHSLTVAKELGFRAMQFNCVVSANEVAVRLWQKHGFAIVGTLPGAFQHPQHGFVDAFVMYRTLDG
ncbi:MAG: GNAT family N-acetyltransferase [Cyanobacteria bacterium J06639_1]